MSQALRLKCGNCDEIILFEALLTTFEMISFFEAAAATANIGSSLKANYKNQVKPDKHNKISKLYSNHV